MLKRRPLLALLGMSLLFATMASPGLAHHGWRWAEDGTFELTGIIESAKLGNPHGMLTVDVEGEMWTVEVGQPWRHERVGLADETLSVGTEIMVAGRRSAKPEEKVVKAVSLTIAGERYVLYPDRD